MKRVVGGLLVLAGGVAIGAAVGVLFAPEKGRKTRKRIAKKTHKVKENIVDNLNDLQEYVAETADELKTKIGKVSASSD